MAKKYRKTRRSYRRNRRSEKPIVKLLLAGTTLTGVLMGVGFLTIQEASYVKADAEGCYTVSTSAARTIALVDSSEPRFDEAQTRDLLQVFENLIESGLRFQERLSVITTEEGSIGSVSKPVLTFCRQAYSAEELQSVGAAPATSAFLNRQAEKFQDEVFEPTIQHVFDSTPDASRRQKRESPILEQIQSASRLSDFGKDAPRRRLILVSDLIQATEEAQFCVKKGHLPSFEKFKTKPYFQRIQPASLSGVEVSIYMLIRHGYGEASLPYCSEDELSAFWTAYFKDAGAASVNIIRLRTGRHGNGQ
jgi:hypothetical protein